MPAHAEILDGQRWSVRETENVIGNVLDDLLASWFPLNSAQDAPRAQQLRCCRLRGMASLPRRLLLSHLWQQRVHWNVLLRVLPSSVAQRRAQRR
jgi:hypothetical protein